MASPRGPYEGGQRAWNVPDAGKQTRAKWSNRTPPGCVGCIHTGGGNENGVSFHCRYILNTGKSRVKMKATAGPNGGCKVKETAGQKANRRRFEVDKVRKKLYELGLTDGEIARESGCAISTILLWRQNHGLPPNVPAHRPRTQER